MAGEAQTTKFMLGSATVMLGAPANLLDLGTADSIGLVKNIVTKTTPGFVTLTQGSYNDEVFSKKNKNDVQIDGEMYEYSLRNLTYAASLDGTTLAQPTNTTITTGNVGASTAATVIPLTSAAGVAIGGYLALHVNAADQVFVRRVTALSGTDATVERGLPVSLPTGAVVKVMGQVGIGSNAPQPYLACKIVGQLADDTWVTQMYPKVRVTSGMNLAFKTDAMDHIPLMIVPHTPVSTDPFYQWAVNPDGTMVRGRMFVS